MCKNGGNFAPNNPNCTSFDDLAKAIGESDSWNFQLFYPEVLFRPSSLDNPMSVIYKIHYFHLSKFTNIIERKYLQENLLN